MTTDIEIRRIRLQRLIGLDETKGMRGDLARTIRAKELGHTVSMDGRKSIDEEIADRTAALAKFRAMLDELA